ncbi:MAG: HAD family phosphatase [Myxococcales bacterium]|jgi:putative hydrolase of the HAD superfamily|nr:MAG: HAD family phosphatase [Myxococcales bacterium]
MATITIEAVLFDLGGVFTDSPFEAAAKVGDELGADPGRMLEIVFGPYHDDTDHPWHRLERGEIALEAARREIIELGEREGIDSDPYRVLALLAAGGGPRQEVVDSVHRLREAGFRTAIVTNNAREFREAWLSMLPFEELFDVIVDSSAVGMRKPNPEIFHHTLRELGDVAPSRAVFLDDFEGNVRAAIALGLHGIVVESDPAGALAALARLTFDR